MKDKTSPSVSRVRLTRELERIAWVYNRRWSATAHTHTLTHSEIPLPHHFLPGCHVPQTHPGSASRAAGRGHGFTQAGRQDLVKETWAWFWKNQPDFHPTRSLSLPWNKMKAPCAGVAGRGWSPFLLNPLRLIPWYGKTLNADRKSILQSPWFPGICFRYLKCICFDSRMVNKLMS